MIEPLPDKQFYIGGQPEISGTVGDSIANIEFIGGTGDRPEFNQYVYVIGIDRVIQLRNLCDDMIRYYFDVEIRKQEIRNSRKKG